MLIPKNRHNQFSIRSPSILFTGVWNQLTLHSILLDDIAAPPDVAICGCMKSHTVVLTRSRLNNNPPHRNKYPAITPLHYNSTNSPSPDPGPLHLNSGHQKWQHNSQKHLSNSTAAVSALQSAIPYPFPNSRSANPFPKPRQH